MFDRFMRWTGRKVQPPTLPPREQPQPVTRPAPVDVTDADFFTVVQSSDKLAVVDFWAEWCQPCTVISAYTGFLAQEYGDRILVAALDVDENPLTPAQYAVMGLPTLIFLRAGVEVDRQVGLLDYAELRRKVDHCLEELQ